MIKPYKEMIHLVKPYKEMIQQWSLQGVVHLVKNTSLICTRNAAGCHNTSSSDNAFLKPKKRCHSSENGCHGSQTRNAAMAAKPEMKTENLWELFSPSGRIKGVHENMVT